MRNDRRNALIAVKQTSFACHCNNTNGEIGGQEYFIQLIIITQRVQLSYKGANHSFVLIHLFDFN